MLETMTRHEAGRAGSATAAIDPHFIAELIDAIGSDDYRALVEAFMADAEGQMTAMGASAARGEIDTLKRAAHRLAGLFSQFGAFEVAHLAEGIRSEPDAGELCRRAVALLTLCRSSMGAIAVTADACDDAGLPSHGGM